MEISVGTSVILYPRSYNKRGEAHLHSVFGVTHDGKEINVKLRIDEDLRSSPSAPSIVEFANTDLRAQNPCVASQTNGPEKRDGVLLVSQVIREGISKAGVDTYVARWAVVLAAKASSPAPVFGVGRMDITSEQYDFSGAYRRLVSAERAGDAVLLAATKEDLFAQRDYRYRAVFYRPDLAFNASGRDIGELKKKGAEIVDSLTEKGVVGGLSVRLLDSKGCLVKDFYQEFFVRFKTSSRGFENGSEFSEWASLAVATWPLEGGSLVIVPMFRIDCGRRVNMYYGSDARHQRLISQFYTAGGHTAICDIVAKVSYHEETDSTLLSRIFPLGPPRGAARHLAEDGGFGLDPAFAQSDEGEELMFFPAGLQKKLIRRSFWLLPNIRERNITDDGGPSGWDGMVESSPPVLRLVPGEADTAEAAADLNSGAGQSKAVEPAALGTGVAAFARSRRDT